MGDNDEDDDIAMIAALETSMGLSEEVRRSVVFESEQCLVCGDSECCRFRGLR